MLQIICVIILYAALGDDCWRVQWHCKSEYRFDVKTVARNANNTNLNIERICDGVTNDAICLSRDISLHGGDELRVMNGVSPRLIWCRQHAWINGGSDHLSQLLNRIICRSKRLRLRQRFVDTRIKDSSFSDPMNLLVSRSEDTCAKQTAKVKLTPLVKTTDAAPHQQDCTWSICLTPATQAKFSNCLSIGEYWTR